MVDGDENSKFFHGYVNNNKRKNQITGLMINRRWSSDVKEIKLEAFRFFRSKFHEQWVSHPLLINPNIRSIDMMDAIRLEAPFSLEEVKNAIWMCGGVKAPSPNGLTFKFIKKYWARMAPAIMNFIHHFDTHATLGSGRNSSLIILAPKVKDLTSLGEYRPISLIGCMYKIISKLLAASIKTVVVKIMGEVQSAYIVGRSILDGPLILNELCRWAKNTKKKLLLFKVYFDKASDSLNLGYLESMLSQMGFGIKWRSWIRGCLSSSHTSVVVNGYPTEEFNITKGVRQADPLSSFLFIIAMEGLNFVMKTAVHKGIFKRIKVPRNGPVLSHLFYVDDALFIGEWCHSNLKYLSYILKYFQVSSGLKVNLHKSKVIGVGASAIKTSQWAHLLGCDAGSLPFTYLGVPVGASLNLKKNWKPITEKFYNKLSCWKSRTLSFGGRLNLIKAVLGNLPTFYMSLFWGP